MRALGIRIEHPGHELRLQLEKGPYGYCLMPSCKEEDRAAAVVQLRKLATQIEKVAAAFEKPIKEKDMSVGGDVIEVIDLPEENRVWINTEDHGVECAIYVRRDKNSTHVRDGDKVWWQGVYAFWTTVGELKGRTLAGFSITLDKKDIEKDELPINNWN